jgi:heterodisulfide reductase subunit B
MPLEKAADDVAFRILAEAKKAGAEVIVAIFPLCHLMLDAKQKDAGAEAWGDDRNSGAIRDPAAGIALGLGPEELGLMMNSMSPMAMVERSYERMIDLVICLES